MPRPTKMSESPALGVNIYDATPPPSGQGGRLSNVTGRSSSPSPINSISSDKENRSSRAPLMDKGKGRMPMGPPRAPSPSARQRRKRPAEESSGGRQRRRRTASVERPSVESDEWSDNDGYNPDQPIEERRKTRAELRELTKNLKENRTELLVAGDTKLLESIVRSNELANDVKQTADATIDSNFLSNAADTVLAKTSALIAGDHSLTIDLDDFINKVKAFMRGRVPAGLSAAQRQRNDEDEENDGEILNWEHMGRECIQHIYRPSVPGFLLGPLSVEKRAKRVIQRKAALKHKDMKETRPEVLEANDIERDDSKNSLKSALNVLKIMNGTIQAKMDEAQEGWDDSTPDEMTALFDKCAIAEIDETVGIALFKFIINPFSFGQTIENLFHVSFLIRDGRVGIVTDIRGLPYLIPTTGNEVDESEQEKDKERGEGKHQSIIELDFQTWRHLIEAFNIKQPIIPHREGQDHGDNGKKGWYT